MGCSPSRTPVAPSEPTANKPESNKDSNSNASGQRDDDVESVPVDSAPSETEPATQLVASELPRTMLQRHHRIAFIGAGPASLNIAHVLIQRGFSASNMVFYERAGRVGGRCLTVPHTTIRGVVHEFGPWMVDHKCLRNLAREVAATPGAVTNVAAETRVPTSAHYTSDAAALQDDMVGGLGFFEDPWAYLLNHVPRSVRTRAWRRWYLRRRVRRYNELHVQLLGKYDYDRGLPPSRPSRVALAALALPTTDFLAQHDLQVLVPLFVHTLGLQAGGTLSTVPALYALLLVTPRRMSAMPGPALAPVFSHGFGALWEELVRVHGLTHCVRLGATVTRVTRADKDGGVAVRGFHGGTSFHDRFDYLVMGAPLMGCGVYMDLDDQEQQLFGAMQASTVRSLLIKSPPQDRYWLWDFNLDAASAQDGSVYAVRDSATGCRPPQPAAAAPSGPARTAWSEEGAGEASLPREQMVFTALDHTAHPHTTDMECLEHLETYVGTRMGADAYVVQARTVRDHWCRFSSGSVAAGAPWQVMDRQATRRTLYVHASVGLDSVGHVVDYGKRLCDTFVTEYL